MRAAEAAFLADSKTMWRAYAATTGVQSRINTASLAGVSAGTDVGVLNLKDAHSKLTTEVDKSKVALHGWSSSSREAHSAARGLAGSVGLLWTTWGSTVPILAGAAIGASIRETIKVGKELEYQLTFVKELAGGSAISFKDFGDAVRGSMNTPKEAAEGLRALAQNGLDAQQSLQALPTILRLATVGEMSVADAAYGATGVMHAFNLEVTDLGRVSDVFAKAAAISNTTVTGMVGAMKQASTVGDLYGVTLEQTAAALAVMAKRNIEASAAGTAFRNMMKEMTAPSDKAKASIEAMGLSFYDAGKNLKSMPEMLKEMAVSVATLNEKGKISFLNEMFGERGAKAVSALLSDYKMFGQYLEELSDKHANFVNRVVNSLQDTLQGKIQRMTNELALSYADAFQGSEASIKETVDALRKLFESKDFKSTVQSITVSVAEFTTVLAENAKTIGTVVAALASVSIAKFAIEMFVGMGAAATRLVPILREVVIGIGWVVTASTLAEARYAGLMTLRAGWLALSGAINVATAAAMRFILSPVGAIITAIGLAVLVTAKYWWDKAKATEAAVKWADQFTKGSEGLASALKRETETLRKNNDELERRIELQRTGGDERLASGVLAVSKARESGH